MGGLPEEGRGRLWVVCQKKGGGCGWSTRRGEADLVSGVHEEGRGNVVGGLHEEGGEVVGGLLEELRVEGGNVGGLPEDIVLECMVAKRDESAHSWCPIEQNLKIFYREKGPSME